MARRRRASALSWADEVMEDQNRPAARSHLEPVSSARTPIRPLGGSNEAYPGLGKRLQEQLNSMSPRASESRVPISEISDEFAASYPRSDSVRYRRNIYPFARDGADSDYPEDATRGRQMERKGSVSRERSPEGMSSGSIGPALSDYHSISSSIPVTRGRRTALDPFRVPGRAFTNRFRDASREAVSSRSTSRALNTPDSLLASNPATRGRRTALDPFNTTEQALTDSSREISPDRATHENIDPALSTPYAANYPLHVTRGRQTAMNPFNSVGRVPAPPRAPSPAPSGSSDASTTVLHSWRTWENMQERLRILEYLDLETGDLFEDTNETQLEIRTIAGDLFVELEDLRKYIQSRSASPLSANYDDDSGMIIPSEDSNVMYASRGPESDTFNEGEDYATGFIHTTRAIDMPMSPFAGYFANRSPDEFQHHSHIQEPTNPPLPPEYADYQPWRERYPLEPGFGVWSPEGRQRIMITLKSLGLSLYTPVATLEKYLINNSSIILHAAAKTTPMRPTVNGDCFETLATGAAYNFNKRLYTAMREVAWDSVDVLDILAMASVPPARYAAAEQEFNRRSGASRVPRKRLLRHSLDSGEGRK